MLLLLALATLSCQLVWSANPDSHVVNSAPVIEEEPYQYAYVGSLMNGDPLSLTGVHLASCVVISVDYALTAAHVMGDETNRWARFGSVNFDLDPGVTRRFSKVIIHEDWGDLGFCDVDCDANDIAALLFSRPLTFTDTVNRITLTDGTDYNPDSCMIMGWGLLESTDAYPPADLHETATEVLSDARCEDLCGPFFHSQHHVCVFDEDAVSNGGRGGPCTGDSGGAVMCMNEETYSRRLVGLCSWVFIDNETGQSCDTERPSGYLDISDYRDWICTKTEVC